jgi:uncharacterized protein YjiS (DUF1127 family)
MAAEAFETRVSAARLGTWLRRLLGRALDRWLAARDRAAQRRWLCGLEDRMLKDLGLSRAQVEREYGKWSWRP